MVRSLVAVFITALIFVSCSKEASESQESSTVVQSKDSTVASQMTKEGEASDMQLPCGGMTVAVAASMLDAKEEEVTYNYSKQLKTCSYRTEAGKSVTYSVNPEADDSTASQEVQKIAKGLGFLSECTPKEIAEEAVYCSSDKLERLIVRKGSTWIDILRPDGLEAKTKVAKIILG